MRTTVWKITLRILHIKLHLKNSNGFIISLTLIMFMLTEYLSLLLTRDDLTQGILYSGVFREMGGLVRARVWLHYVSRGLTGRKESQMTQQRLGLTKSNMSLARMPSHSLQKTRRFSAMLFCQCLITHPKVARTKLRAIRLQIYLWPWAPFGMYARWPGQKARCSENECQLVVFMVIIHCLLK